MSLILLKGGKWLTIRKYYQKREKLTRFPQQGAKAVQCVQIAVKSQAKVQILGVKLAKTKKTKGIKPEKDVITEDYAPNSLNLKKGIYGNQCKIPLIVREKVKILQF